MKYLDQSVHRDRSYGGCLELQGGELFNGYRVSFVQNGRSLWLDGGDGCMIMGMYLIPLKCTHKVIKVVNITCCC